jgi:3-deoxy-manno-octulosonate cytidylyltransferase (CMP-KDO synthetase)
VVNVQGDEPTLDPASIDGAVAPLLDDPTAEMATLCTPIRDAALARDPNIVKVVCDRRGYALYFSRACIPYLRDASAPVPSPESRVPSHLTAGADPGPRTRDPRPVLWRKHIGLYVYRREVLLRLAALAPSALELAERLEQLRALDYGIRIVVVETEHDAIGVDVPADISRVAALLGRPASTVRGAAS